MSHAQGTGCVELQAEATHRVTRRLPTGDAMRHPRVTKCVNGVRGGRTRLGQPDSAIRPIDGWGRWIDDAKTNRIPSPSCSTCSPRRSTPGNHPSAAPARRATRRPALANGPARDQQERGEGAVAALRGAGPGLLLTDRLSPRRTPIAPLVSAPPKSGSPDREAVRTQAAPLE